MIAKGLTPENGAKAFAIMNYPRAFHDREGFSTPWGTKPFAIMKKSRYAGDRGKNKPLVRKAGARQRLAQGFR
jgi:hypothetical protein